MTREQKFFNALRDVFVGAKVEGESGYINLTGKWIKRITADPSNPLRAGSVEFDDGEVVDTKNLDWKRIKPLIW